MYSQGVHIMLRLAFTEYKGPAGTAGALTPGQVLLNLPATDSYFPL